MYSVVLKCSFPYLALKNDNKIPTLKHITNVGSNANSLEFTVKNIYSFPNESSYFVTDISTIMCRIAKITCTRNLRLGCRGL